ncbi:L-lactate permease, partial [Pseudoxanthomonas sp. SGD-10]
MQQWTQNILPLENTVFSALLALVPIAFIFWALIIKKMKGYKASGIALVIAFFIAVVFYRMPIDLAGLSTLYGGMYGLFPICWIVITAMFLFNLSVESGQFAVIRSFMSSITPDRRLQALLIAFSFGAFLEGTAGYGAPVAITAAMLAGLGFNPLYAAGICLIANTAPVAFGAVGIPITVLANVSGIPEMVLSKTVGRTLPILSAFLPYYLVAIMAGMKKANEVLPAILVSGLSFAFFQWFSANYLGPALPDVIAGAGSVVCLIIFLKYWKPKSIWRFANEKDEQSVESSEHSGKAVFLAWMPFLVLTVLIICWGLDPVKKVLDSIVSVSFNMPGIHHAIIDSDGNAIAKVFKFNLLSTPGTAILLSCLLTLPLAGLSFRTGIRVFSDTLNQLKYPIITITCILGFAYILNDSGMTITIAAALSATGWLFPFFSPVLGWLGVFITGSDTSANALFGKLQYVTATAIGVDPVVTVSANASGGVVGKMISPQSLAVAAAGSGLVGRESDLFRFTIKHSFILLFFICLIVMAQAYFMNW